MGRFPYRTPHIAAGVQFGAQKSCWRERNSAAKRVDDFLRDHARNARVLRLQERLRITAIARCESDTLLPCLPEGIGGDRTYSQRLFRRPRRPWGSLSDQVCVVTRRHVLDPCAPCQKPRRSTCSSATSEALVEVRRRVRAGSHGPALSVPCTHARRPERTCYAAPMHSATFW